MFDRVINLLENLKFLDVSDIYKLFISGVKFSDTYKIKLIQQLLPPNSPPDACALTHHFECQNFADSNTKEFRKDLFMMKLIFLLCRLDKYKICYFCKKRAENKLKLRFSPKIFCFPIKKETWRNIYRVTSFDCRELRYLEWSHCLSWNECFTLCMSCKTKYNFVSINSYCRKNGLRKEKIFSELSKYHQQYMLLSGRGFFAPYKLLDNVKEATEYKYSYQVVRL